MLFRLVIPIDLYSLVRHDHQPGCFIKGEGAANGYESVAVSDSVFIVVVRQSINKIFGRLTKGECCQYFMKALYESVAESSRFDMARRSGRSCRLVAGDGSSQYSVPPAGTSHLLPSGSFRPSSAHASTWRDVLVAVAG